jgi:D-alanine-D-alanine ligase
MAGVAASQIGTPAIVKPACQGSTIGVTWVHDPAEFASAFECAFHYDSEVLAERLIAGTEITGGVLGNRDPVALPLVEIVPAGGRYDYEAKYTPGATEEIVPARIPDQLAQEARATALSAHQVLGCRGMSRADMIAAADGVYLLEVNTIPGMTSTSLLPRAAAAAGIEFPDLVARLIDLALEDGI